jgi:hypothetical protein
MNEDWSDGSAPRDVLVRSAQEAVGLTDLPPLAVESLARLTAAFEREPRRSEIATIAFYGNCDRRLRNYLALSKLAVSATDNKQLRPNEGFTVIAGLPRTGTTLLHNALALEPGSSYLRHLELTNSWSTVAGAHSKEVRNEVLGRLELIDALSPEIRDAHPLDLMWPDECTLLFESLLVGYQWPATYGLASYLRTLENMNWAYYYREYARFLPLLLRGTVSPQRVVLKSPFHTTNAELLADELGKVRFVMSARPSYEVVTSWLGLVRAAYIPMHTDGRLPQALVHAWIEALDRLALASAKLADDPRCEVVLYEDLRSEPSAAIEALIGKWGRELRPAHRQRIRLWMRSAEALRRQRSRTLAFFGLGAGDLDTAGFRRYDARFGFA